MLIALTSSTASNTFLGMFYLLMAWRFAGQPVELGVVFCIYELVPN